MKLYVVKKRKICIYIVPRYTNYGSNHQATIFKYLVKQNTQALAW